MMREREMRKLQRRKNRNDVEVATVVINLGTESCRDVIMELERAENPNAYAKEILIWYFREHLPRVHRTEESRGE